MKIAVYISLLITTWLLSCITANRELSNAFYRLHLNIIRRIYRNTLGRVVVYIKRATRVSTDFVILLKELRRETELLKRFGIQRKTVDGNTVYFVPAGGRNGEDITENNIISAIVAGRRYGYLGTSCTLDQLDILGRIAVGNIRNMSKDEMEAGIVTAFTLCDTNIFDEINAGIPNAQLRILEAIDRFENVMSDPALPSSNYRRFIRFD